MLGVGGGTRFFQVQGVAMIFAVHMVLGSSAGVTGTHKVWFSTPSDPPPLPKGCKTTPSNSHDLNCTKRVEGSIFLVRQHLESVQEGPIRLGKHLLKF